MVPTLKALLKSLIDLIYPPRCLICGAFLSDEPPGLDNCPEQFCRTCFAGFTEITPPLCPICGRPFTSKAQEDHPCEACMRKPPFYHAARAAYAYDSAVMEAVHLFKYGGKSHMAAALGPLLAQYAANWLDKTDALLTVPVPLHTRKLRERGFNQSVLLARHVAGQLNAELDFLSLSRVRYTPPQTGLGKDERRKNVRKAFELDDPGRVRKRTVLLVDDVATTGHTLNECARVLKRAGAKRVLCLVLARTIKRQ